MGKTFATLSSSLPTPVQPMSRYWQAEVAMVKTQIIRIPPIIPNPEAEKMSLPD